MNKLETKIITKIDKEFLLAWYKLWRESNYAHFFNTPEWFIACLETEKISDYKIFACYKGGNLCALYPVAVSLKFGVKVLSSPTKKFSEKSTLLVKDYDPKVVWAIFDAITKNANVYLHELEDKVVSLLLEENPKILASVSSINPYINVKTDSFRFLSKKQKSKVVNKVKKNLPNLSYVQHRDNLTKYLAVIFDIEAKSYKKLKKKDIFSDSKARSLYKNIVKYASKYVSIDIVYYNNKPVVYSFGFIYKNTYLAFHTAYLASARHLSPGKILLYFLLNNLRERNFELFDFARGHNILKKEFTPYYHLQYDLYYSRNYLIRAWWNLINFARRIKAIISLSPNSKDGDFLFKKYEEGIYSNIQDEALYI